MDNSGQYKSLFKSFRRAHPKESTEAPPLPSPAKDLAKFGAAAGSRPITAQKSVDELLAGRSEIRPQRRDPVEVQVEEETPLKSRKSIDQILAGGKAKRRTGTTYSHKVDRIESGAGESSDAVLAEQPISARKQVSEILAVKSSTTLLRPLRSSHGRPQLTFNDVSTLSPTPSLPDFLLSSPKEPVSKAGPLGARRSQSQSPRVVFDFSGAAAKPKVAQSKSLQILIPVRARSLMKLVNITPVSSTITFSSSSHAQWHKNKAFEALLSSIDDSTQTTEHDSRDNEECQTEIDSHENKWTQRPIKSCAKVADLTKLHEDADGCGSDPPRIETPKLVSNVSEAVSLPKLTSEEDELKLAAFARNTSRLMLSLITVNSVKSDINVTEGDVAENSKKSEPDSPISPRNREKSIITEFDRGLPYLNKLSMHTLCCNSTHIACANAPQTDRNGEGKSDKQEVKNIITVWTTKDILSPKFFLRVWGQVTRIKLAFSADIIVAGAHNGSLNIWDLREDEKKHVSFEGVYVRTPSFHTGCMDGENHHSEIIGLEVLPETSSSAQIISLEKNNKIICWSCIHSHVIDRENFSANSVAWSTLRVRVRQVLILPELFKMHSLNSTCLNVWEGDHKYFVIATNNGYVGKGRIVASTFDTHCEKFFANTRDSLIRIQNVDVNVKMNLIIAACNDFSIRIFEMSKQRAIISIACVEVPGKVLWSKQRLSVFYVSFKDKVVIWDLIASDLTPMKKCKSMGVIDFDLVMHENKECLIMIAEGGKKLFRVIPPCDLAPLDTSHEKLMRHYITVSL